MITDMITNCQIRLKMAGVGKDWKRHVFFIYDSEINTDSDPPENAIYVFLAPEDVDLQTQVYI